MNVVLEGYVDSEMLEELVKVYNEAEEKQQYVNIYFSSLGGDVQTGYAIIDIINRYKDVTTIRAYSVIASMAVEVFMRVKCKREILEDCRGLLHLSRWQTHIKAGGTPLNGYEEFKYKEMKAELPKQIEYFKWLGVTEAEVELLKKGEDLSIGYDRLQKMLKRVSK